MASLNMKGSFPLTNIIIDKNVTEVSPGNYALGRMNSKTKKFIVSYVGRSDEDVNERLHDWVENYKEFKFSYASSPKAAYEKECRNFHDFGGVEKLDNEMHPRKPENSRWKCPVCGN